MGRKAGTKRSDRRWLDDDGVIWDSRFEYEVYRSISADSRLVVRRCRPGEGDSLVYTTPIIRAQCLACGSSDCVQGRTYTPDVHVIPKDGGGEAGGFYLEIKGHLPGPQRNLLRNVLKAHPHYDLRFVLQADRVATSSLMMSEYITKYFKRPFHIWDGRLQGSWYHG